VESVEKALEVTLKNGAKLISDLKTQKTEHGITKTASIQGFGDILNEFVERPLNEFRPDLKNIEIDSSAQPLKTRVSRIDHFTNNVTHLVASRVGSCKYQLAMRMELPVVTQDWVEYLTWQSDVPSDEKFRLQALYGCCITVTGLPQTDRNIVEATARMFGAEFSPDLRRNRTTHLIAAVASGAKYDAAIRWGNITVVPPKWFYDSVVNQSTPPSTFLVPVQSESRATHLHAWYM
jgi:hypothetical protein